MRQLPHRCRLAFRAQPRGVAFAARGFGRRERRLLRDPHHLLGAHDLALHEVRLLVTALDGELVRRLLDDPRRLLS